MPAYPVLPRVWTLDGMVFGDGSVNRYLTEVTGWAGRPGQRANKTDKVAGSGSWLGGHYNEPRTIPVKGCWRPTGRADAAAAQDALTELCSSGDALTQYVLRGTESAKDRWCYVILDDELDPQLSRGGLITFDTQLFAADSRWFSAAQHVWDTTALPGEALGGVLWNGGTGTSGDGTLWNGGTGTSGGGLEYQTGGTTSTGQITVSNAGNDVASLVITMTATGGTGLSYPYVTISGTGETLQYNGILAVGSVLTIDTGTGRVTTNGVYTPGVLKRRQMFQLPARSTRVLSFGSTVFTDQGLLYGYNYDAYQGG